MSLMLGQRWLLPQWLPGVLKCNAKIFNICKKKYASKEIFYNYRFVEKKESQTYHAQIKKTFKRLNQVQCSKASKYWWNEEVKYP